MHRIKYLFLSETNKLQKDVSQLSQLGITPKILHSNLSIPEIIEFSLRKNEGILSTNGALCVTTGAFTGRSPEDRFIVYDDITSDRVNWGKTNQPMDEYIFNTIFDKVKKFVNVSEMFVFRGIVGADVDVSLPVCVVTDRAWQCLFANNMFIKKNTHQTALPEFTVIVVNDFTLFSEIDKTKETFIIINIKQRLILIGGTSYAGEIKKAMFSVMNFLLPEKDVLPMHCSANVRKNNNVALFFGLSGTGKTTLSTDRNRNLIGDDEHGWSENGVFNFEGGCYAKCINLKKDKEPQIWNAIKFGSILENVVVDPNTRIPDFTDATITENTRASYPLEHIDGALLPSKAGHPNVIIFLTADAFGVLPPVAKLTTEGAMYHFMSGYTSKLAGTEKGVKEPKATFSECFGAPFMPRDVRVYANMLGEKIKRHDVRVYLVNTGWMGGPYGVGKRIDLKYTRAIISAILGSQIEKSGFSKDNIFNLDIPKDCPKVPPKILNPKNVWINKKDYEQAAKNLASMFVKNFEKFGKQPKIIMDAGPKI